jgi:sarcosine/dimethylglycine N-methyltransferase
VPEQKTYFLERGVRDEVVDVVSAVEETTFAPVDEADLGGGDDDVLEAGLGEGPCVIGHGCPETAFLYHTASRCFKVQRGRAGGAKLVAVRAGDVLRFYDDHPIAEDQVLAALARAGKDRGRLAADDLFPHDQDHYGGLAAVEALARRAGIGPTSRVLDVCAGLGGPARFLAHHFGSRVTALDLNHTRSVGAQRLTRLVGLSRQVVVVRADAQALPFRGASFTAVVSQEGFLHVPDKAAALRECHRVLVPGGRIAFSDWTARPRLEDGERRRLETWMAAVDIQSLHAYRMLLAEAGFAGIEAEDLSPQWVSILRERRRMYVQMRADIVARLGEARYDEYNQLYAFFVGLVEAGKLGGGRFSGAAGR